MVVYFYHIATCHCSVLILSIYSFILGFILPVEGQMLVDLLGEGEKMRFCQSLVTSEVDVDIDVGVDVDIGIVVRAVRSPLGRQTGAHVVLHIRHGPNLACVGAAGELQPHKRCNSNASGVMHARMLVVKECQQRAVQQTTDLRDISCQVYKLSVSKTVRT